MRRLWSECSVRRKDFRHDFGRRRRAATTSQLLRSIAENSGRLCALECLFDSLSRATQLRFLEEIRGARLAEFEESEERVCHFDAAHDPSGQSLHGRNGMKSGQFANTAVVFKQPVEQFRGTQLSGAGWASRAETKTDKRSTGANLGAYRLDAEEFQVVVVEWQWRGRVGHGCAVIRA
jgi:hypothetical protein